jgi:alginate O-acetyltransferase complex protein AlgI
VLFRAGTVEAAWNILGSLDIAPRLEKGRHLGPLFIVPLVAFLLPASQDIIALLTRKPRPWLAALLGVGILILLIELGEQHAYEFAYYKF